MLKSALYCCLYAAIITIISVSLTGAPSIRQMENVLFDFFQKMLTIDDYQSYRYDKFRDELDGFFFINIDNSFFDFQRERIKKRSLARLLDTLREKASPRAVFVDYLYEADFTDQEGDSILIASMEKWGDRLVLPLNLSVRQQSIGEYVLPETDNPLLGRSFEVGYLDYRRNYYDFQKTCRAVQVGYVDEQLPSVTYALIQSINNSSQIRKLSVIPAVFELNYVLRNYAEISNGEDNGNRFPVVDWRDASQVVEKISLPSKDNIVFVGSFASIKNQYGKQIDVVNTPVARNQAGIYVIINSYLNVITQSYLRSARGWLVFVVNALLAAIGLVYVNQLSTGQRKQATSFKRKIAEFVVVTLLFLVIVCVLFTAFYVKFPFVISSVFFVVNIPIYNHYKTSS